MLCLLLYLIVCACDFACFVILITGLITSYGSRSQWYMTIHWWSRYSECRSTDKENNKYKNWCTQVTREDPSFQEPKLPKNIIKT
jgi:hypothetical protein